MYYIIILYYIIFYYIISYHIKLYYIYIICICNFHLLAVRLFVRWRSHSGRGPLFARLLLSHGCVGSLAILGKQCACALGLTFGFDRGLAFFSFDINPLNTEPNAHCHSPAALAAERRCSRAYLLLPGEIPLRAVSPGEHTFFCITTSLPKPTASQQPC